MSSSSDISSATGEKTQTEVADQEEIDTRCGYGASCKPNWLQKCANPKMFLVVVTLYAMVQGFAINGINNVNISSYERRYQLDSRESSLIASMFDIGAAVSVLPVGYLCGKGHKPRILAISLLMLAAGCFVMSMAHFTSPSYEPLSEGQTVMCSAANGTEATCGTDETQTHNKIYIAWLLAGQAMNGIAAGALWVLGVAFIDMTTPAHNVALYLGIMAVGAYLGPSLGFLAGGYILRIYVDYPGSPPIEMSVADPAWVGAWWIGFVATSIMCTILSLFMFMFPKEFPDTAAIRKAKVSQAHDDGSEGVVEHHGFRLTLRDIPKATLFLIKNPAFMFINFVAALELMVLVGLSTFSPKFVQHQYGQTVSWSPIMAGIVAIPATIAGQLVGGAIIKRFKMNVTQLFKFALIATIASAITIPLYLVKCSGAPLAGVTTPYHKGEVLSGTNLTSQCNAACGCSTSLFDPVCAADGVQYFSLCHAGCDADSIISLDGNQTAFTNCSCYSASLNSSDTIVRGQCKSECNLLYTVYVPVGLIHLFFLTLNNIPATVATLRVVPEKIRTYGIGFNQVIIRLLGSIPGPLIFGAVYDSSCTVWEEDCEGNRGSCWAYDNQTLAYRLVILLLSIKALSILFNILAMVTYKPPTDEKPL